MSGTVQQRSVVPHIRWAVLRDMPEIMDIEQWSFAYPWCKEDFTRCLRQRNCIGMVAEVSESVVGYMVFELHKTKIHILNFAVKQDYRRAGVGRAMVDKLKRKLSNERRRRIMLEVRDSNLAAQLFFNSCGFKAVSVLRDFYPYCTDDAYVFVYKLPVEASVAS